MITVNQGFQLFARQIVCDKLAKDTPAGRICQLLNPAPNIDS
jgi:hypothetical protein